MASPLCRTPSLTPEQLEKLRQSLRAPRPPVSPERWKEANDSLQEVLRKADEEAEKEGDDGHSAERNAEPEANEG
jgi:hypothetical protein